VIGELLQARASSITNNGSHVDVDEAHHVQEPLEDVRQAHCRENQSTIGNTKIEGQHLHEFKAGLGVSISKSC
jgi:hypothetical protein